MVNYDSRVIMTITFLYYDFITSSVTRFAIYRTLGNFLKPLAAVNLPKSPTFLGNFL